MDDLWTHVRIREDKRIQVLAWILDGWRPDTEKTLLELYGQLSANAGISGSFNENTS